MHGSPAPTAERMNTAQAVVRSLAINGIDTVFCLPGVQNDPFFDALFEQQDQIRAIHSRHEQGAAYMALGAAMATGKPAAYSVVPGPGFLNTTAALATAYGTNAPVLAVIGQIPLPALGRGLGLLHEIPDQIGIMRSLTKWAQRIQGAAEAPATVAEAPLITAANHSATVDATIAIANDAPTSAGSYDSVPENLSADMPL